MSVSNNTTTYFNGNSSISFRSLQSVFGGNFNTVKFSTYIRDASVDSTNPIVPNATENANIVTTASNLKASQFRGSIKYYILSQSGNDSTLDIDAQSWNSNLNKNVIKYFNVGGVMAATNTTNTGGSFSAEAYNMKFSVGGYIYGSGGAGGNANSGNGSKGGDALQVTNNSNRSGSSAKVEITINSTGRIWAGGGGGGAGSKGGDGPGLSCFYSAGSTQRVYDGGSTNPQRACNRTCLSGAQAIGAGWNLASNGNCDPVGGNRKRCRKRQERGSACVNAYNRNCNYRYYYTVAGGTGGNGGNGGAGQGANTNQGTGNGGNNGNTNSCAANGNNSTGAAGNSGASGGSWGSPGGNSAGNGGGAGRAIFGSGYNVTGANTNNVKGAIS
jgi:hypothetical protein